VRTCATAVVAALGVEFVGARPVVLRLRVCETQVVANNKTQKRIARVLMFAPSIAAK
jgi:hypothetical protein